MEMGYNDLCWKDRRDGVETLSRVNYTKLPIFKPHHGPGVGSTVYYTSPSELTFVNCKVHKDHWKTTTGVTHCPKIPIPTSIPVIRKAPTNQVMNYMFPNVADQMKRTSKGMLYNPSPVYNTITKTDYRSRKAIADFDFINGPLVSTAFNRFARNTRKSLSRPGFPLDEYFGRGRKAHPYLSVTAYDYIRKSLDCNCCSKI